VLLVGYGALTSSPALLSSPESSIPAGAWTGRRCGGTSESGTCGSWCGGSCWRWPRSATGAGLENKILDVG
jgi:hypothetical protein